MNDIVSYLKQMHIRNVSINLNMFVAGLWLVGIGANFLALGARSVFGSLPLQGVFNLIGLFGMIIFLIGGMLLVPLGIYNLWNGDLKVGIPNLLTGFAILGIFLYGFAMNLSVNFPGSATVIKLDLSSELPYNLISE